MKQLLWFVLFLMLFTPASADSPLKTIPAQNAKLSGIVLSSIVKQVTTIPLEMTSNSIMGEIMQWVIGDQIIFALDQNSIIYAFNRKGKFLYKINRKGRGPQEYLNAIGIAADFTNNRLYISDFKRILQYTLQGEYLNSVPTDATPKQIQVISGKLHCLLHKEGKENSSSTEIHKLLIFNHLLKQEQAISLRNIKINNRAFGGIVPKVFSTSGKQIHLYSPVNRKLPVIFDTLFTLKDNQITPSLKVQLGKQVYAKSESHIVSSIYRTSRYLFVEYTYQEQPFTPTPMDFYTLCYDLQNNTGTIAKGDAYGRCISDDVHDKGKIELFPMNEDLFYYAVSSPDGETNPTIYLVELRK